MLRRSVRSGLGASRFELSCDANLLINRSDSAVFITEFDSGARHICRDVLVSCFIDGACVEEPDRFTVSTDEFSDPSTSSLPWKHGTSRAYTAPH